jgi:acylglycerol lipase
MVIEKELFLENRDGIQIYVKKYLPGKEESIGKTILLIHGIGIHGGYYLGIARKWASMGISVVTIDLHGHGHSGNEKGKFYSLETVMSDIDIAVENEKSGSNNPIYLLGESMGGVFSYCYAKKYPQKLAGLILVAPAFLERFKQFMYFDSLKFLFYLFIDKNKPVVDLTCGRRIEDSSTDKAFKIKRTTDPLTLMKVSPNYLMTIHKACSGWRKGNIPGTLRLLMFHGTRDKIICIDGSKIFYNAFKGTDKELKIYDGSYHTLFFDEKTPALLEDVFYWLKDR